jgi:hypothetical protein
MISGVSILQAPLSQCKKRLVGLGVNAHDWGGHNAAIAGAMSSAIKATAATARARAFMKAPARITCICDMVGQPSRTHPNTLTFGTVPWLDRFARASAELAQSVRIPHAWRILQPRVASNLLKAAVWGQFETLSSACTNTLSITSHAAYVGNPLPQYVTGIPAGAVLARATHYDSISYACISHCPSSCPHSCHA